MPYCVMFLYLQNVWISGIFGDITCRILQYALALSIAASILTHALVALDRFFGIVFLFKRVTFIKNPKISYSFIWCSSLILMSPYLVVYGKRKTRPKRNQLLCCKDRVSHLSSGLLQSRISAALFSSFGIHCDIVHVRLSKAVETQNSRSSLAHGNPEESSS